MQYHELLYCTTARVAVVFEAAQVLHPAEASVGTQADGRGKGCARSASRREKLER